MRRGRSRGCKKVLENMMPLRPMTAAPFRCAGARVRARTLSAELASASALLWCRFVRPELCVGFCLWLLSRRTPLVLVMSACECLSLCAGLTNPRSPCSQAASAWLSAYSCASCRHGRCEEGGQEAALAQALLASRLCIVGKEMAIHDLEQQRKLMVAQAWRQFKSVRVFCARLGRVEGVWPSRSKKINTYLSCIGT